MGSYEVCDYLDYNPAHAIWYILETMVGWPAAWLDATSFLNVAQTLPAEGTRGRGVSVLFQAQQPALSYVGYILKHINGILFYGTDKKLHLKLLRDDYDVDTLPVIDETMLTEPPSLSRAEAQLNQSVSVEYSDRVMSEVAGAQVTSAAVPGLSRGSWAATINEVKVQYAECVRDFLIGVRLTQQAIEVIRTGLPNARVTQQAIEVIRSGAPKARVTQQAIEVIRQQGLSLIHI